MKYLFFVAVCMIANINTVSAQKLKNESDSLAYAIGVNLGNQLKNDGMDDVDMKIVMNAIKSVIDDEELALSNATAKVKYRAAVSERKEKVNQERKEQGLAFLVENAKRPEVKQLSNNIHYEVLIPGNGPKPAKGGDVTIHYEGKLLDGTVFDSSYERGTPNTFNLKRLIKGWQIALPEMKVGEKWRIYIPYDMAYGERGAGSDIKPFSTLVFDIELLDI